MNLDEIKNKVNNKMALSESETAFFIRNHPHALANFMLDNNAGSVNMSLRKLGYDHLGFAPDKKAIARQLDIIINQGHNSDFLQIQKEFHIDTTKLPLSLLNEIQKQFNS
jgi:hypothetical protein